MTGDQPLFEPTEKLNQRLDIDFALQAAGLGVWEMDPATRLVVWDDRCRELFGLARHNYLSYEQAIQYIHGEDVNRVSQAVQWAMSPGSNGLFDETYRTIGADDGQLRWVRFYGRSYFSEAGALYRFAGVAQEVTQQVLTQQREASTRQEAQRQQRIYEAIASSTPDLMYVFDLNYRFIYANQALLAMWGSTWEKAIGKGLLENGYEPWHAQLHEREIDQVVATKQAIRGQVAFPHAQLGKRIYDYVFAPVLNEQGEVEAVAGTTRDITESKQAEQTLRESEKNYRMLFEAMQDGYTVCEAIRDADGQLINYRFRQVNPAFSKLTGLDPAQTLGKTVREVLPGLDPKWFAFYQQVLDTRQPSRVEDYIQPLNEWYALTAFWFADDQFAVLFERITERKRTQAALQLSEERFRSFVMASSDVVYTMSADWRQMNQLVGKTFLADTGEPSRDWLLTYIPVEDQQSVEAAIDEAIAHKRVFELEHQVIQADGQLGWAFSRAVPIQNEQGQILEWFGTASDVTEQKRAEEALKESEEQFRLLADALPLAIWVTDSAGRAEFMNKWWAVYSGNSFEPITAWQVAMDSLHPEDGPRLVATFQQAMRQGKGFQIEQRNRSASGEYRWFLNVGEPYHDPQTGQITKWVGMGVDIDDRKRAQQALAESESRYRALAGELELRVGERTQALQQANQDLTRSNANLQQFAYVASHDLQEPLRKIQSFSSLLAQQYGHQLDEKALNYLDRIGSAGSRMSTLIKDLLAYSRISTRQQTFGPVSLEAIVAGVVTTLDWAISQSGGQLTLDALPVVNGDESQLSQLFQNLLSNALKFVSTGQSPQIHIAYIHLKESDLPTDVQPDVKTPFYHQISVIDQGIGFDEKFGHRIFQVFQRLHGKSEYAGTGVGLAICQRVVENHGGAIRASSQVGHGACFEVYLPA